MPPIDIGREVAYFPLTFKRTPEPELRVLFDIAELYAQVFWAELRNCVAKEAAIFVHNKVELRVAGGVW